MIAVFVSHSSANNSTTRDVHAWLDEHGFGPVFVDFSYTDGMTGGQEWWPQLAENVKRAKVFLILGSAFWKTSDVCREELTIARSLAKPIVILRLDETDLGPYLSQIQFIDFTAPDAHSWQRLGRALTEAGADPSVFRPDPARPPFPGLPAFEVEDSALYFGRETEIIDMLTRLDQRRLSAKRLLVIAGPSGSGKSSLLRAGLIARLRRKAEAWVAIKPFRPSRGFDEGVITALEATCADWYASPQARQTLRELADPVRADPARFAGFFRDLADEPDATPVLAVDQGEELFSGESGQATRQITETLARLLAADSPVFGLLTIRSDMLGALQQHPVLGPLIMDDIYALAPMPRERYALLIDGPVAQYARYVQPRASVEPALRDALIEEATGADALPLVAFTLRTLWDEFGRGDGRLLASQLSLIGGVGRAVARIAEQIVADAPSDLVSADLDALRTAFVPGLAGVTEDGEIVRRHVREVDLPHVARPLLDRFVQARLLVRGDGPDGERYLEIAHEALLRQWPRLVEWIQQDFDALRALEELGRAAAAWQVAGRDPDLLAHRGEVLEKAAEVVEQDLFPRRFAAGERDTIGAYLAACQNLERERAGRQFSLEITLAAALYERVQRETAQRRLIHAVALGGAALDSNPYIRARDEVIASCGREDVLRARSLAWRVRSELHAILGQELFAFEFTLEGRSGVHTRLIFHADNETLAVIGHEQPFDIVLPTGAVREWPATPHGKVLDYLPARDEALLLKGGSLFVAKRGNGSARRETQLEGLGSDGSLEARLSADGSTAVVMDPSGSCLLVDFAGKSARDVLSGISQEPHPNLYGISVGGTGEIAVAGTREVFVIDPVGGKVRRYESGQRLALHAIEIISAREELAFGGVDSGVYVLTMSSGERYLLGGHGDSVSSLALLEKDELLVSTGWDGRAIVWDLERRRHVLDLPTEGGMLRTSAASPDGERLAIADDRAITIWRKLRHEHVVELPHGNMITGVACQPGRRGRIVSVSFAGKRCAAIWTVEEGTVAALDLGIRAPLRGVAMAPSGDLFAVCGDMPDVIVFSAAGTVIRKFVSEGSFEDRRERMRREGGEKDEPEPPGFVRNVSISHDSAQVAWVAPTGHICVGNIETGEVGRALPDAGHLFSTVCFSPTENAFLAVTERGEAYWVRSGRGPRLVASDVTSTSTFGRGVPVAFSQDGRKLAMPTGESGISIISPDGQEPDLQLDGHTETFKRGWRESVGALAFDPRGDFLVSAGSQQSGGTDPRTIRLWDPHTGDQLMRISIDQDCLALSVDPFGDAICAGYGDKVSLIPLRRWLLSADTAAVRKRLENILGSSYNYVV